MEAGCHPEAPSRLQKLRARLCRETDPQELYKTLKKLSSLPVLSDLLAEIGFRQVIKGLRKQELLVPYAKDLAARWSEGTLLESQHEAHPDPDPQPWASVKNLNSESPRTSPEEKEHSPASGKPQEKERRVSGVSSGSPGPSRKNGAHTSTEGIITTGSGSPEPRGKRVRRCRNNHLHWSQGDSLTGTLEACRHGESSPSPRVPPLLLCRRKETGFWEVAAPTPGAKAPLGQSASCSALGPRALSLTAESHPSGGAGAPLRGLERSSRNTDQGAALWTRRVNSRTPVYSGARPASGLPQTSLQGPLLAEDPAATWAAHRQAAPAKAQEGECGQPREESRPRETRPRKRTHSQTETQTPLQLNESQELRLQALRARIQSTQAQKRQGRLQAKMTAFPTQVKSPGQREESGPPAGAPFSENHLLPEASAHSLTRGATRLPAGVGGPKKRPAKKRPAPLMAKALRDYHKSSFHRRT